MYTNTQLNKLTKKNNLRIMTEKIKPNKVTLKPTIFYLFRFVETEKYGNILTILHEISKSRLLICYGKYMGNTSVQIFLLLFWNIKLINISQTFNILRHQLQN